MSALFAIIAAYAVVVASLAYIDNMQRHRLRRARGGKVNAEQAKTKWCPMVRHGQEAVNNREGHGTQSGVGDKHLPWNKCVAEDCMMWRWDAGEGYCGLAGKEGAL